MRYGPNGISIRGLNFFLSEISHITEKAAAIQNAKTRALIPADTPSSQPIPSVSFASPRPIHFPFDTNHSNANGNAKSGPAMSISIVGTWNHDEPPTMRLMREMPANE